jgi:hypothetical protein
MIFLIMVDYSKPDDTPLLGDLDKEMYHFEDLYKLFLSNCETIEKEILKFQNIQDKEKIQKL